MTATCTGCGGDVEVTTAGELVDRLGAELAEPLSPAETPNPLPLSTVLRRLSRLGPALPIAWCDWCLRADSLAGELVASWL